MADGVLHEREHDEARHLDIEQRLVHAPLDVKAVPEPGLLDLQVLAGQLQLRPEAQRLPGGIVEHRPQEAGQSNQESVGGRGIAVEQRRDRLEGVEEEVGMELPLQQREAGFAEMTREPPGLDFLLLAGLRVLHGRGPEEDQEIDERAR